MSASDLIVYYIIHSRVAASAAPLVPASRTVKLTRGVYALNQRGLTCGSAP